MSVRRALAAWTPVEEKAITPYAAEKYPKLFSEPDTSILTVLPERTFWEKYNAVEGSLNVITEYETPEFLGWTAGVYCVFNNFINR